MEIACVRWTRRWQIRCYELGFVILQPRIVSKLFHGKFRSRDYSGLRDIKWHTEIASVQFHVFSSGHGLHLEASSLSSYGIRLWKSNFFYSYLSSFEGLMNYAFYIYPRTSRALNTLKDSWFTSIMLFIATKRCRIIDTIICLIDELCRDETRVCKLRRHHLQRDLKRW